LDIGIGGNEFYASYLSLDHSVHCISARTPNAHHPYFGRRLQILIKSQHLCFSFELQFLVLHSILLSKAQNSAHYSSDFVALVDPPPSDETA
jgi:hypothetical protein